jgi:transcriptional regulator GlxA family with amidase domain
MPPTVPAAEIPARIQSLEPLIRWLGERASAGSCVGTSCTGSFLLAEAGLLDGRVTTTHWRAAQAFRDRYPQVILRESELVVEDGNLVCSGGAVSYIDLALHLVRRFAGPSLAMQCARMLVFDPGRDRQSPYHAFDPPKAHGDSKVLKAQEWLEANYWQPVDLDLLAGRLGMSLRNLKRRFKAASGQTITGYLQHTRIAAASDRLASSDRPIQQIIFEVGYLDASSFGRMFRESVGVTMGEYRRRFRPDAPQKNHAA